MADMCVYQNSTPCVGGYALRPPRYYPPIPPWTIRNVTVSRLFDDMDIYDVTYDHYNWTGLLKRSTSSDTTGLIGHVIGSNTPNVTRMGDLFLLQRELTSVISLDTPSVNNTGAMFSGCSSLVDVPMLDLADVTNCAYMFRNCTSLVTVPLFDTGHVTNFFGLRDV